MKIFINDAARRNVTLYKDHRRKEFSFQIAQISFVVFMAPFFRLKIFIGPPSLPKIFGSPSKYVPAPYPALLMTWSLKSFIDISYEVKAEEAIHRDPKCEQPQQTAYALHEGTSICEPFTAIPPLPEQPRAAPNPHEKAYQTSIL